MEKVSFEELYNSYMIDRGEFFRATPRNLFPKCKETKNDIFGEIDSISAPNKLLWIAYLRKVNDITKLICYDVYMRTIAKKFELETRMELLSSDDKAREKIYTLLNIPKVYYDDMVSFWAIKNPITKEYIEGGFKGLLIFKETDGFRLLPALAVAYYERNGVYSGYKNVKYNTSILYLDETDLYFTLQANEIDNFQHLATIPFLAIGDAYVGGDNGYMKTRLYRLIKKRLMHNLPTVIATELTASELATVDNRIYRRTINQ